MKPDPGSRTRSTLKKIERKYKQAGQSLADSSHISRAAISRALSGKSRPNLKTLHKLVDLLDTESGTELVAAYLMDLIPLKLQKEMCISVRRKQDGSWQCWDPLVQKILSLTPETRALLERVTDAMLQSHGPFPPLPPPPTLLDNCHSWSR
jgi:transcriptional regulator with XRE-family HTH domain